MNLAQTALLFAPSSFRGTAAFLKWLARIMATLTLLWLLLFGYLDATLGDFFGPPDWTAILLVALVGWLLSFAISSVAKRILIADQSSGCTSRTNLKS